MIGFWGDRVMRQLPHFPISPFPHFPTPHTPHPTSPHPTPHFPTPINCGKMRYGSKH
ncbi:hypothetical protein C789_3339 [Microcystis aeruginosa FACHB-905 = DIANCHI905]|nr:hypothetical protein C789_3339 [Microcystis aeruginosa FACHB-905 = DIANCHI905]